MKHFAIKLFLFAVLFLAYDKIFLLVANRSAEVEADKRLENVIMGKINSDIVILGSSRGSRGILAGMIEKETGISTINLCYPGSNVEFHEFVLRTLLKYNKPPKTLALVVDDSISFLPDTTVVFRRDLLYPLVKYPHVREELIKLGYKDKYISKFLVLHQLNKANFDLREKVFTPLDTVSECGSMTISWQQPGLEWYYITREKPYRTDDEIISYIHAFQKIIETCAVNNIKLVIVFPPLYRVHSASFENRIRQLGGHYPVYYVYNTENPAYKNKDNFFNRGHLRINGARIFTAELTEFLKSCPYGLLPERGDHE